MYDKSIINKHIQRYETSCIPSCVEMILKLLGKIPSKFYDLQEEWQNKQDGSFGDFNGQTICGVTFNQEFTEPRGRNFPMDRLFKKIDQELQAGRFVCVSLCSTDGWHMYIIHEKINDNYASFSKSGQQTIEENNVRQIITNINGTDILTYFELG